MTSGRRAVLAILLYLAGALFLTRLGPYAEVSARAGRSGPPEERPGIPPAAVSFFLNRLGEDGRALYARALVLDLAIPILYVAAGWAVVTWARERRPAPAWPSSMAVRLLILVAAAELVENVLLLAAVSDYPREPPVGGLIGPAVTAKMGFVLLSVLTLVGLSIWVGITARRARDAVEPASDQP
jgi:hypothetical protein